MSSCGALLPRSPPSAFYVLTATEPPATTRPPPDAPSVLLAPVALPPYLDRRELVTRVASTQLRVEDLELWAEPLRDSVPRTIERDLATALGDGTVQRAPWTRPSPPEIVVSIEIRRFEKTSRRTVELAASWTVAESGANGMPVRRETSLSLATDATTGSAVVAMSEALSALSRQIAGELRRVVPQASAPPAHGRLTPPTGPVSGSKI
jgi:uncharacterized protein